ncbi:MAG TPA: cyclodeaminase/cyclohydrolase family protein [Thermoleophilaceae bacterium]
MTGLAEQPLGRFLEDVAAARPAPGGGTSAGCACALAAALVEMAACLARERVPEDGPARARALRERALELAERELSSYEPVLAALRIPADDPMRERRVEAALAEASRPPLAIAEAAAETAVLAAEVARASSPSVRGDALTGAVLAEAAAAAAAGLVEINLAGRTDGEHLDRAREASRLAGEARAAATT